MIWLEILFGVIAALLVLFLLYALVLVRPRMSMRRFFYENDKALFTDYAHRGLHGSGIPENSLAAFAKAAGNGHGIELDLQLSSDGQVMVFHDYSLKRMTGCDRLLAELTADELRELRLGDTDEKIPFFTEVLELISGRVPMLIELKGENADTSVCSAAFELLKDYTGEYCVESFNPFLLRWFRKNASPIMRGILVTNVSKEKKKHNPLNFALGNMLTNALARPDFIAYDVRYRNRLGVDLCTKFWGAPAFAWTVRVEGSYYLAREYGAYVIFEGIKPEEDDRPQI